jgi:hypothetical protein
MSGPNSAQAGRPRQHPPAAAARRAA